VQHSRRAARIGPFRLVSVRSVAVLGNQRTDVIKFVYDQLDCMSRG
jgi:hypothetical protein